METLDSLFENNRTWAEQLRREDPNFFLNISRQQSPPYLWIGCSDSRVPASQVLGLLPGDIFVHRNIANLVLPNDLNCLSVLQYAIEILKVRHVIVCGHYGCGGVLAALRQERLGLIDEWLQSIREVRDKHKSLFQQLDDETEAANLLCELNVIEQAVHVAETTFAQDRWQGGPDFSVHGWIYGLSDGLLKSLDLTISNPTKLDAAYEKAITGRRQKRN